MISFLRALIAQFYFRIYYTPDTICIQLCTKTNLPTGLLSFFKLLVQQEEQCFSDTEYLKYIRQNAKKKMSNIHSL